MDAAHTNVSPNRSKLCKDTLVRPKTARLTDAEADMLMGPYIEAWERTHAPHGNPLKSSLMLSSLENRGLMHRIEYGGWGITQDGYDKLDEWQRFTHRTICPLPEELSR